jgi:hypothetical protein
LFINLCDSFHKDDPSFLDVVILLCMNFWFAEEQPLHLDVPQVVPFTSIVNLLKVMSLTPHGFLELKSLDYDAITIEFVNCFPTKFNGDILFEFPHVCHLLGHFE